MHFPFNSCILSTCGNFSLAALNRKYFEVLFKKIIDGNNQLFQLFSVYLCSKFNFAKFNLLVLMLFLFRNYKKKTLQIGNSKMRCNFVNKQIIKKKMFFYRCCGNFDGNKYK